MFINWKFSKLKMIFCSIALTLAVSFVATAEEFVKGDVTFTVDDSHAEKYPEIIELIIATKSMDDDERQYWFDIMPSMTEPQIDRLYDILETEWQKLLELEIKYQDSIDSIKSLSAKKFVESYDSKVREYFKAHPDHLGFELLFVDWNRVPSLYIMKINPSTELPTANLDEFSIYSLSNRNESAETAPQASEEIFPSIMGGIC